MKTTDTSKQTSDQPTTGRLAAMVEDPMGQAITATVAVIGSFGLVLSGIWMINLGVS